DVWGLNTPAGQLAGLGPFRLKEYVPGEKMVLERNPYYWKADRKGTRLPYLDRITFLFVASEDAQVIRFQAGDTEVINKASARDERLGTAQAAGPPVSPGAPGPRTGIQLRSLQSQQSCFQESASGLAQAGVVSGVELPQGGFRGHRPRSHRPPGVSGSGDAA